MRLSPIRNGVPLLAYFVILAKLIDAGLIQETDRNREKNLPDGPALVSAKRSLYAKDGFLAGEETPVWFAKVNHEGKIKYNRVPSDTGPIVKRAVNYWNSIKDGDGFPVRKTRSVDYSRNFSSLEELYVPRETRNIDSHSRLVEKRSAIENEVLYPSILVVMDYHDVFEKYLYAKEDKNRELMSFVESLVLYALAFWGTVDSSLRNIQNPRVSLRIAGIIITKREASSPYLAANDGADLFSLTLPAMSAYWKSLSKKSKQFPIGSYDIVAHMTDKYPSSLFTDWEKNIRGRQPKLAAAITGPPCKLPDHIGSLIFYDDFNFVGLHDAIAAMSKVLGGRMESPKVYGWPRRIWTKDVVDPISNALKSASCMTAPKEYYPPGTPVAPILAGELRPTGKQCESAEYETDGSTCWETSDLNARSDCRFLACLNRRSSGSTCLRVGLILDGSFCNDENTKICLDGECVDKI